MKKILIAFCILTAFLCCIHISAAENSAEVLTASPSDRSVNLSWSIPRDISDIEKIELRYSYSKTPERIIKTADVSKESSSYSVTGLFGDTEYLFTLTVFADKKYEYTVKATPADSDKDAVNSVIDEINAASLSIHMNLAYDIDSANSYAVKYFKRYEDSGIIIENVNIKNFKAAEENGAEGGFDYIVTVSKGNIRSTTRVLKGIIDNSVSAVYLTADRYSASIGETISVTANTLNIEDAEYLWFVASNKIDDGIRSEENTSENFIFSSNVSGEYYVYCIVNGAVSERILIVVNEPFVDVTDINLINDSFFAGSSIVLRNNVIPINATNSNITWSIEDDGGCKAHLTSRTLSAELPGMVTVKATIKNGLKDGDFEKTFKIRVNRSSTDTEKEPEKPIDDSTVKEIDCEKINGIESLTLTTEKGNVDAITVSKNTISKVLDDVGIDGYNDVLASVRFLYDEDAVAHDTVIKLKNKNVKSVKMITVNGSGSKTVSEHTPENGVIYGNTVSPDMIIILAEDSGAGFGFILPAVLILALPALFAALIIYKERNKRKERKK